MSIVNKILIEALQNFREENMKALNQYTSAGRIRNYIVNKIPNNIIEDVGLAKVLEFLIVEDGMNLGLEWAQQHQQKDRPKVFKDEPRDHEEEEIDYIIRTNRIKYSLEDIKNRLLHYFIRRLVANIPTEKPLQTEEEVWKFIKTYEQAFIYNYLLPMAKTKKSV